MVDDGWTDDGRTPDHGHPISSPCEPNGSGELKRVSIIIHVIYIVKLGYTRVKHFFLNIALKHRLW